MSEQEDTTLQNHGIISKGEEILLDMCTAENCCNGKIHCPFCDVNHFKPTKPHRVRDHLELLHLSYAVQAEGVTIVKCFWSCGQVAGHYHCPYCPSKLLKRYAFTLHLHSHMKKMGKDKSCISVPDPKYPNVIKAYGKEIPLCKDESCYKTATGNNPSDATTSTDGEQTTETATTTTDVQRSGPHYHCPLCNVLQNRRSPLLNHLWRCVEQPRNSRALAENWKKATTLLSKDLQNVPHPRDVEGLKYHKSIVRTLSDLSLEKCYDPNCNCGHKYHCPLCTEEKFKPNFLQHLQSHYYAHWKRRIPYKEYSVLLCNDYCEFEKGCHKLRYHFHCPICGLTRRRRKSFARHLKICPGFVPPRSLSSSLQLKPALEEAENTCSVDGESVEAKMEADGNGEFSSASVEPEHGSSNDMEGIVEQYEVSEGVKDQEKGRSLADLQVFDPVIAKLSDRCLDALRDKGDVEEIFSDICLRSGADFIWNASQLGSLPVHKFVGSLKVLEATKDLVVKLIVGDLNVDQLKQTKLCEEKQTQTEEDVNCRKCMDTGTQVETSTQTEVRVTPPSPGEENFSVPQNGSEAPANTCSKLSSNLPSKRPLTISDKDCEEQSSKRPKIIPGKIPGSPAECLVTSPLSPKKRGRPRKLTSSLDPSNISKVPEADSASDAGVRSSNGKTLLKRKRGRPKKDRSNKVGGSNDAVYEKDPDESCDVAEDLSSSLLQSKHYSTRGKKIDFSFLVGKPKKNELYKTNGEDGNDGDVVSGDEDEESPSSETVGISDGSSKTGEAVIVTDNNTDKKDTKNNSSSSSSHSKNSNEKNNNDNVHSDSEVIPEDSTETEKHSKSASALTGTVLSKSKYPGKKAKPRVFKPLVMSDIAVLPAIRDLFTSRRRQRNNIKKDLKSQSVSSENCQGVPLSASLSSSSSTLTSVNELNAGNVSGGGSGSTSRSSVTSEGSTSKGAESKQVSSHMYDLKCRLCGLIADQFDTITDHLKQVHSIEDPLRCDVCQRTFDRLFDLKSHLSRKHGPFPHVAIVYCSVCGKSFHGTAKLNWHMSFIHKIQKEPDPKKISLKCNQCPFVAPNNSALISHKETHTDDSKLCNLCGKLFSKGNHLITHIQAVHTKEKAAQCKLCGKQFNHIRYLRTHMKRHEGIKKHECHLCGWRFFESNTLKDHLETHKDASKRKYRFTCDYCGQKHISKANFNDHLNKHTGNKPHKCQLCGKGFAFRTMLMKHQIHIHTTEKPFKCTSCDRGFKFKSKLLQHMVIHTGVSKYVCPNCNKPFSCSATLKHHTPRCKGDTSWQQQQQNKAVLSEGMTLMVDGLQLEQQQVEASENIVVPVGDQNDIVIDMSDLSGIPEGNILQAAAQAAQLMEMPEVFMCSECNAVFSSLAHAESHVMTCRIDVAAIDSPNVEIKVLDDQQNTNFVETDIAVENTTASSS
ncbi:uncharacterized protein LOC115217962 [Argonauta hians]